MVKKTEFWNKIRDNIFWVCFVALILTVLGGMITLVLPIKSQEPFWTTFALYFDFWGAWFMFLLGICIFRSNRFLLKFLGWRSSGNTVLNFLIGIAVGFVMNATIILFARLHGDFDLGFAKFELFYFLLMFLAVLIQSSSEELICRVFIYQRLRRGYKSPWVAILVNPLFFTVLHLGNDGISPVAIYNLFAVGLFFTLLVYYFNSFWMAAAAHTMWNFNQNIIFGLPNSGNVTAYSVFKLENGAASSSIFYDPNFGVEGSIASAILITSACIVLFLLNKKNTMQTAQV